MSKLEELQVHLEAHRQHMIGEELGREWPEHRFNRMIQAVLDQCKSTDEDKAMLTGGYIQQAVEIVDAMHKAMEADNEV